MNKGIRADSQKETSGIVSLGVVQKVLDGLADKMVVLVLVSGSEVGNEAPLLLVDEDGTGTGGGLLVDVVEGLDTLITSSLAQDGTVLVLSNRPDVSSGTRLLHHPLAGTHGVLASSTSNVLDLKVLDHLLIKGKVLLLSKASSPRDSAILLEEGQGDISGDVQEGVADTNNKGGRLCRKWKRKERK